MIGSVSWSGTTYADLPYKFEAGTPNFNAAVTLKPAIDLLQAIRNDEELNQCLEEVKNLVYQSLNNNPMIHLHGTSKDLSLKIPVFSFTVDGVHHEDLALILDKMGIALRSGHMCAEPHPSPLTIQCRRQNISWPVSIKQSKCWYDGIFTNSKTSRN